MATANVQEKRRQDMVKNLVKIITDDYARRTRGQASCYLTDAMRRALVADIILDIMLTRYETEAERENHTDPNLYVDASREAWKKLEL